MGRDLQHGRSCTHVIWGREDKDHRRSPQGDKGHKIWRKQDT